MHLHFSMPKCRLIGGLCLSPCAAGDDITASGESPLVMLCGATKLLSFMAPPVHPDRRRVCPKRELRQEGMEVLQQYHPIRARFSDLKCVQDDNTSILTHYKRLSESSANRLAIRALAPLFAASLAPYLMTVRASRQR